MKTIILSIAIAFSLVFCGACWCMSSKNSAISLEEIVQTAKSDIDVQLSNRFQKLHELAACVKRYDEHEYKTLVAVIEARGKNMSGKELNECMSQINVVAEQYPQLQSSTNYGKLMLDISLTENLLAQTKNAFNRSVKDYKYHCRKFPTSTFLDLTGYEVQDFKYYETSNDIKSTDGKQLELF